MCPASAMTARMTCSMRTMVSPVERLSSLSTPTRRSVSGVAADLMSDAAASGNASAPARNGTYGASDSIVFAQADSPRGKQMATLSPHTVAVVTFALCGFANFSSIAIQMAVTGGLAPNQRPMIAKLGLRALAAGSLANLMSAALAGLLIS